MLKHWPTSKEYFQILWNEQLAYKISEMSWPSDPFKDEDSTKTLQDDMLWQDCEGKIVNYNNESKDDDDGELVIYDDHGTPEQFLELFGYYNSERRF